MYARGKVLVKDLESNWYQRDEKPSLWLRVLAWVYQKVSRLITKRRQASAYCPELPTIVVGNLTVGGTGKSPVVQALVTEFKRHGLRPCILSRGYQSQAAKLPQTQQVQATDLATRVGDEPLMLHQATGVPVWVNPKRVLSAQQAVASKDFDVLILDDGLQHWALKGHFNLCVVDGAKGFGNRYLLPAGPLREPLERLQSFDAILINGAESAIVKECAVSKELKDNPKGLPVYEFHLEPLCLRDSHNGQRHSVQYLRGKRVQVMVGIGNPERFIATLHQLGMRTERIFKGQDHQAYSQADIDQLDPDLPIVTTAKDWVKLKVFDRAMFVLDVEAKLPDALVQQVMNKVMLGVNASPVWKEVESSHE
jgi:tetraacyldisaccharide 4'-kinase